MKVLYINTAPPPNMPGTEAIEKEILALRESYDGDRIDLYPFKRPVPYLPPQVIGLQSIFRLKKLDSQVDLHHVFSPGLYRYPFLRFLRHPVVFSVAAGMHTGAQRNKWLKIHIVVGSQRDLDIAQSIGIDSASLIRPGIDTSLFVKSPMRLSGECTLLSASAPWTLGQFNDKGFNLLFRVAAQMPDLRLVILWRGLFYDVLLENIEKMGIGDRVTVINEYVDISAILPQVHGGIILASRHDILRAFPHSMMESLAAGKPVIISGTIPMADYIHRHGCGCVIENHSVESLGTAIQQFIRNYPAISRNAMEIGGRDFDKKRMIDAYGEVYREALSL